MKQVKRIISNVVVATVCNVDMETLEHHKEAGDPLMDFITGVKLYHVRGGLWRISGYAETGEDVDRTLERIRNFKEVVQ